MSKDYLIFILMRKVIVLCFIIFSFISVNAQDYNTGIGLRAGYYNGLTVKHFISSNRAIEGLVSSRWRGLEITGLYEINHQAFNAPRLNWYYGVGAHVGFWNGDNTNWGDRGHDYAVVGIDGIIGIEYNFTEIPFNVSLDWKPAINIIGYSGFWADGVALSIRYIF